MNQITDIISETSFGESRVGFFSGDQLIEFWIEKNQSSAKITEIHLAKVMQIVKPINRIFYKLNNGTEVSSRCFDNFPEKPRPVGYGFRAQVDRKLYKFAIQNLLYSLKSLTVRAGEAEDIWLDGSGSLLGVICANGDRIRSAHVIITTGTFLGGIIHIGEDQSSSILM